MDVDLEPDTSLLPAHLKIPCTRSRERPVCQLLDRLDACNEVLVFFGLQLREDEAGDVGDLRLVAIQGPPLRVLGVQANPSAHVARDLLQWLLGAHLCLVSVDLLYGVVVSAHLTDALIHSRAVRRLNICTLEGFACREVTDRSIAQLIASIDRVEQLAICYDAFSEKFPITVDPLSLGRSDIAFRSLYHPGYVDRNVATRLVTQLITNNTVTSLAVGYDIFRLHSFVEYLTKNNSRLKVLALRSNSTCYEVTLRALVTAISTMSVLEELTVEIEFCGTQEIAIFAEVVARNRSLRRMSLKHSSTSLEHERLAYPDRSTGSHQETLEVWLSAFKTNSVLEKLTMDFLNFEETDCHTFFRAAAQSKSLKQFIVLNLPCKGGLKDIYGTIRECGLAQKLLIKNHCLDSDTPLNLSDYSEVTAGVVDTVSHNLDLQPVLDVLRSCDHICSLVLRIDRALLTDATTCSLVELIARAPRLQELWLNVVGDFVLENRVGRYVAPAGMVRGISSNKSLTNVTLIGMHLTRTDCGMFVEAAVGNPKLYHLELNGYSETNVLFVRLLAPVLARSYNLVRVVAPIQKGFYMEQFVLQDLTRRNSGLIIRAARFVMGDQTGHCVRALEFVSAHPKLVEMVAQRAAVSCCEAKEMIRRALSGIAGVHAFMRAAGVVRDRVQCCAERDGQMKLDDLNADCWWHVRKYLKVADVLEPPHVTL